MIYGSICSGIEAVHFAADGLDWDRRFSSEIDKFPSAVLAHHWPDTPNLGDFTKIKASDWPDVEMICGGPPCQSFSLAGHRGGLNDDRGNLTFKYVDMCHDFATNGSLRWAFYENVPGILSDKTNAFGCLISGLIGADDPLLPPEAAWGEDKDDQGGGKGTYSWQSIKWPSQGMASGPRARLAWRVLNAQYFGLAQRRKRVLIVVGFADGCDPAKVLFERKGLQGDFAPRKKTWQRIAENVKNGIAESFPKLAPALKANGAPRGDQKGMEESLIPAISYSLRGEGFDASEDGSGRGTHILPKFKANSGDVSYFLTASAQQSLDAETETLIAFNSRQDPISGDVAGSLGSSSPQAESVVYSIQDDITPKTNDDLAFTLRTPSPSGGGNPQCVAYGLSDGEKLKNQISDYNVRRLTVVECARLQGFPDHHTLIDYSKRATPDKLPDDLERYAIDMGFDAKDPRVIKLFMCPDGPQYKAYGNSWAVNKIRWVFRRMDYVDKLARGIDPGANHLALTDPF